MISFKFLAGVSLGIASVALVVQPGFAAVTDPGVLETINASGGTNATDGLKLDVAFGNIQIGRDGQGQLYSGSQIPDASGYGNVRSYPVVALSYGGGPTLKMIGSPSGTNAVQWDSFTSESTLTNAGRSGNIVNHLRYGSGTSLVTADYTISYTYPNLYFNVKFDLTSLGSDYAGASHRLYWFTDAYLGGSDSGYEFGGTTPGAQTVAGVYSTDGSLIEAFRQTSGQRLDWFAGDPRCPYRGAFTAVDCGASVAVGGFTEALAAFPNSIATATSDIDNGFGVSSSLSTAATDSMNFDLIFAKCVSQAPLPCADGALGSTPALPNTGVDSATVVSMALGAVALAGVGVTLVLIRRRKQA